MDKPTFYAFCEALCRIHNASETSGYRTRQRNTAVGGATRSRHLEGAARDLVLDENTVANRVALVRDAQKLGLWALDEDTHVHVHIPRD